MSHYLAISLMLLWAASLDAQEIHSRHFFQGIPKGAPASNDLVFRDIYVLSSNDTTRLADWVAYQLTPHEVMGHLALERDWKTDPFLEADETLEAGSKDDYEDAKDKGYDRGHLAPLASFRGSRFASQANYYSNIVPQQSALNRGVWGTLEDAERELTMRYRTLHVMVGTLYEYPDQDPPKMPKADEGQIPSAFWKILVAEPKKGELKVAAFIFRQDTKKGAKLEEHLVTVDEVEKRAKLDFMHLLPDDTEDELEKRKDIAWITQGH